MIVDPRITREGVLHSFYSDTTHTIWSPSATLSRMAIEFYPHQPKRNLVAMRRVLEALFEEGLLMRRYRRHATYTLQEVASERVPGFEGEGGEDLAQHEASVCKLSPWFASLGFGLGGGGGPRSRSSAAWA